MRVTGLVFLRNNSKKVMFRFQILLSFKLAHSLYDLYIKLICIEKKYMSLRE